MTCETAVTIIFFRFLVFTFYRLSVTALWHSHTAVRQSHSKLFFTNYKLPDIWFMIQSHWLSYNCIPRVSLLATGHSRAYSHMQSHCHWSVTDSRRLCQHSALSNQQSADVSQCDRCWLCQRLHAALLWPWQQQTDSRMLWCCCHWVLTLDSNEKFSSSSSSAAKRLILCRQTSSLLLSAVRAKWSTDSHCCSRCFSTQRSALSGQHSASDRICASICWEQWVCLWLFVTLPWLPVSAVCSCCGLWSVELGRFRAICLCLCHSLLSVNNITVPTKTFLCQKKICSFPDF